MAHEHPYEAEETEQIERYLLHEMNPEQQEAFRRKLLADAELRERTSEMQLLLLGIQEAALQEQMDGFHAGLPKKEEAGKSGGKVIGLRSWMATAAVLLLVGTVAWLLLRGSREDRLYARYFRHDVGLMTAMATSDNYTFDRAMIAYKTGNYKEAIAAWQQLYRSKPANDTLNYFLGAAYLNSSEAAKAIPFLEKAAAAEGSSFRSDAYWYLGLAWLKEGNKEAAVRNLEKSGHKEKTALLMQLK